MFGKKKSGIYAIVNTIDGKAYIGSSTHITKRWSDHRKTLRDGTHNNPYLQHAYAKHGAQAFEYRILEIVDDPATLAAAEWRWIVQWDTLARTHGYNLRSDTQSPVHAPESRQRMSDTQKRRAPASPETRKKISDGLKGRPVSPETRQKISDALKIRLATPEGYQKRSNEQKKRFASPEERRKISEAGKTNRASPEARRRMSEAAKKGRTRR